MQTQNLLADLLKQHILPISYTLSHYLLITISILYRSINIIILTLIITTYNIIYMFIICNRQISSFYNVIKNMQWRKRKLQQKFGKYKKTSTMKKSILSRMTKPYFSRTAYQCHQHRHQTRTPTTATASITFSAVLSMNDLSE